MPDEAYISFKDMCARFEVTPRTLRYYEYIELLSPRREGRTRWYGPREIARMTLIMRARRFGFSLEDARQWLMIYQQKGTRAQYEVWIDMAAEQLKVLEAQRDEIDAAMTELRALREETLREVENLPPDTQPGPAAAGDADPASGDRN